MDGYVLGASFDSGSVLRWYFNHVLDVPHTHGFELALYIEPGQEYEVFLQGPGSPCSIPTSGRRSLIFSVTLRSRRGKSTDGSRAV